MRLGAAATEADGRSRAKLDHLGIEPHSGCLINISVAVGAVSEVEKLGGIVRTGKGSRKSKGQVVTS
jgi:hypothetical protein